MDMSNKKTIETAELEDLLAIEVKKNEELRDALKASEKRDKVFFKEAEDSKEKYRDIFHNSQVGLSRTRASDGKLLEANDRLASMFGYKDRQEMLDEFCAPSAYQYARDREYMLSVIKRDGEINDYEVCGRKKDGSNIWVRYSAKFYPEEGYLDVVVVDITNEKKAEKEKEHLYSQLAQSQKMEEIGRAHV